jgi:hypothetical protein
LSVSAVAWTIAADIIKSQCHKCHTVSAVAARVEVVVPGWEDGGEGGRVGLGVFRRGGDRRTGRKYQLLEQTKKLIR